MSNPRILQAIIFMESLLVLILFVTLNRQNSNVQGSVFPEPVVFQALVPPGVSFVGKPMADGAMDFTLRVCPDPANLKQAEKVYLKRGEKIVFTAK
jgi:hypothetical protein